MMERVVTKFKFRLQNLHIFKLTLAAAISSFNFNNIDC